RRRGWLPLDGDLEAARRILRRILDQRGNAYIVPKEYRFPQVSQEEAHQRALQVHNQLVATGKRLAPFSLSNDDIMWWTFIADDLDAIEHDVFPGQVRISVDKLDGHIRTEEEYREWLRLSAV